MLRDVACKVMAALLHASLLLSFSYSIALGLKIVALMWRLKNDLASLSIENNRTGKVTKTELACHLIVWSFCILCVVGIIVYERLSGDPLFSFGEQRVCLMIKGKGVLYLVIVPTVVTLVLNIGSTLYSVVSLYSLSQSQPLNRESFLSRLLLFLGRMISFQSIQWIFGLVYYLTNNEIVGFLFEVFGSFEGLIIFSALIAPELKSR